MTEPVQDASSKFQDSLPLSSDALLEKLQSWKISFNLFSHVPLNTVEDSKKVQGQFKSTAQGGGHIKNLYLRDHKKKNILVVAEQDRSINLTALKEKLGVGRLSFGSADRLLETLGVRPGAVTPLSMINGVKQGVALFIDSDLQGCDTLYVHPLVNDRTISIKPKDLLAFMSHIGVTVTWVDL
ncbi:MAG: prolyl-tRNA synthetase associated domain-containing protein [Paracoccaceae bacterium]|jgi:Ala-tRNA(Pro) deacylase